MRSLLLILLFISNLGHADELKLMTWNVFMLPKPIKNSFQKTRTDLIAKELADSDRDIILFQEAFSGRFKNVISRSLKQNFPYQVKLKKKFLPIIALGSGIMIVSRYPLEVLGQTYYKDCRTFDCYATKGAVLIEVTLPSGKRVQILNTHLQSGQNPKAKDIRKTQLTQIRELLDQHKKENVPQILSGDLNVDAAGEEFGLTQNILDMKSVPIPEDVLSSGVLGQGPRKFSFFSAGFELDCYEKRDENLKLIDHVLYRENGNSTTFTEDRINHFEGLLQGRTCPLSDHHARQIDLQLP